MLPIGLLVLTILALGYFAAPKLHEPISFDVEHDDSDDTEQIWAKTGPSTLVGLLQSVWVNFSLFLKKYDLASSLIA